MYISIFIESPGNTLYFLSVIKLSLSSKIGPIRSLFIFLVYLDVLCTKIVGVLIKPNDSFVYLTINFCLGCTLTILSRYPDAVSWSMCALLLLVGVLRTAGFGSVAHIATMAESMGPPSPTLILASFSC